MYRSSNPDRSHRLAAGDTGNETARSARSLPVPRHLLMSALLAIMLAACRRGDDSYRNISVSINARDELSVFISGATRGPPCPPWLDGSAFVNGVEMTTEQQGGVDFDVPDSSEQHCAALQFKLDVARLPMDTETLDITFDLRRSDDREYAPARAWQVIVEWRPERIWTVDDLAARMRANEEFELHWTPEDTLVPELKLSAFADGSWGHPVEASATLVSSEPGLARFRFDGPEPTDVWSVLAVRERELAPTVCSGFRRCAVNAHNYTSLSPSGISPATPPGEAPPRECIALPTKTGADYRSPEWFQFPDLSQLQLDRRESCQQADLYFVVLGACGVCGGGKSTYAIGNRGTQPANFSVRSNQETVEGALLEPQQLSKPFEISFQGALSQLEIVTDDDCDPTSNTAAVASVVCEDDPSCSLSLRPLCEGRDLNCNNTCGL